MTEVSNTQRPFRFDTVALCLTCGATRKARAHGETGPYSNWAHLFSAKLTCTRCMAKTPHQIADQTVPQYGKREDATRKACERVNALLRALDARSDVSLRWVEGDWCLGNLGHYEGLSLEWHAAHPGETYQCGCGPHDEHRRGAQPAGTVVDDGAGKWLVDLDMRQPRERLEAPLEQLLDDLKLGKVRTSYLRPAYAVTLR